MIFTFRNMVFVAACQKFDNPFILVGDALPGRVPRSVQFNKISETQHERLYGISHFSHFNTWSFSSRAVVVDQNVTRKLRTFGTQSSQCWSYSVTNQNLEQNVHLIFECSARIKTDMYEKDNHRSFNSLTHDSHKCF